MRARVDDARQIVAIDTPYRPRTIVARRAPASVKSLGQHEQARRRRVRVHDDAPGSIGEQTGNAGRTGREIERRIDKCDGSDVDRAQIVTDVAADSRVGHESRSRHRIGYARPGLADESPRHATDACGQLVKRIEDRRRHQSGVSSREAEPAEDADVGFE